MRTKTLAVTVGLTLALVGCRALRPGGKPPQTQKTLRPSLTRYRGDVPVPEGFVLRAERSFYVERPLLARLVYEARGVNTVALIRFYLKEMPVARWQRTAQVEAAGRTVLVFHRDGEVCLIHIEHPAGLLPRTRLTVEIVGPPEPRGR